MAMVTFGQAAMQLLRASQNLSGEISDIQRFAAQQAQNLLIENTPVRTGKARTNWRINFDGGGTELNAAGTPEASAAAARAQGTAALAGYRAGDIYVVNYAHYIGRLNNGWSAQAPAEFVRITLMQITTILNVRIRHSAIMELR